MEDGKLALARAAFDKAIAARIDTLDSFYRRGVCSIELGDAAAALPDLERVVAKEPNYDFGRAAGLLAHTYALTRQKEKSEALFRHVTITSTLSETYLNFADQLLSEGRNAEARELLSDLGERFPTLGRQVLENGDELAPFVNVYVDSEDVRTLGGLDAPVREGATVILLPAMAGGA